MTIATEQPATDSGDGGVRAAAQELARRRWAHRQEPQPEANPAPQPAAPIAETAPEPEEPASESELEHGQDTGDHDEEGVTQEEEVAEGEDSEGEEPEEQPGPLSLDDLDPDATVVFDGKEISVAALRESGMRQEDYTRKTQALAAQRETLAQREKLVAFALGQQEQTMTEQLQQMQSLDWQGLAKTNPQEFQARQAQMQALQMQLQRTRAEQKQFLGQITQFEEQIAREQAKVAQRELKERIPGWNNAMYYSLVEYAASAGFNRDAVLKFTDPSVFVVLQKAKAYDEAKKVTTKKTVKASPKRTPQAKGPATPERTQTKRLDSVRQEAAKAGTIDAALELLRAKRAAGTRG